MTQPDPRGASCSAAETPVAEARSRTVIDLFAGPGGWDEGAKPLGLAPIGIEWDMPACRTAMAAGHTRVRADVETLPTEPMVGKVWGLIASPPCQDFSLAGKQAGITGEKGRLITQVLRWTNDLRPRWIACEQVPPCLPVWEEYAEVMRSWGYRTWTGVLNAADYGVPQTRKRAILLASLDRQPDRPLMTHAQYPEVGDLFGGYRPGWISMASALGWERPVFVKRERSGDRAEEGFQAEDVPSQTLTSNTRSWVVRTGNNSMVTGRTGSRAGDGDVQPYERSLDEPAPTLDTSIGSKWTVRWPHERPATTIVGSFCPDSVAAPGYRTDISRQDAPDSVRVSIEEAGILQSFRADYPWQGSRTKQFQQVGNAVPPLLATHVLAAVTGLALPEAAEAAA